MQELMRRIGLVFASVVTLLSVVMAAKCIFPRAQMYHESCEQRDQLQAEVDQLKQEITQTKRDIGRLKTSPYYLEQLARTNHCVADNEFIFIFK